MVFNGVLLLIAFPFIVFSVVVQGWIHHVYVKYQMRVNPKKVTGEQAAQLLLKRAGLSEVTIKQVDGELTDAYDKPSKTLRLSAMSYKSRSLTSLAVTSHEVGHAMQFAAGYLPALFRRALLPALNVVATLAFPMALIGIVFTWDTMANTAIGLYAAVVLIHLLLLPIELNADKRVRALLLEEGLITEKELKAIKSVQHAASMNYIALSMIAFGNLRNMLRAFRLRNGD